MKTKKRFGETVSFLPPLRTITELAEEFGVTRASLAAHMGKHKTSPGFVFKYRNNTWYDPEKVRTWWESIGKGLN